MGRRKGLPAELLARIEANQRASVSPRDFRGDPLAIRAQEEHARHCSCCQRRLQVISSPIEVAAIRLAAKMGAAADSSNAELSAALLEASTEEVPLLRRALELSLSAGTRKGAEIHGGLIAQLEISVCLNKDDPNYFEQHHSIIL